MCQFKRDITEVKAAPNPAKEIAKRSWTCCYSLYRKYVVDDPKPTKNLRALEYTQKELDDIIEFYDPMYKKRCCPSIGWKGKGVVTQT